MDGNKLMQKRNEMLKKRSDMLKELGAPSSLFCI